LIAGNTIVYKPSEQSPAVGQWMVEKFDEAGFPPGVVNLIQGGRQVGSELANHRQLDGLLFTGSNVAGRALHRAFGEHPEKILALEMGGNNPLIVDQIDNLSAAAYHTILSAFISAGQRCTCARRLIVVDGPKSELFLNALVEMMGQLLIGPFTDVPEPFAATVISSRQGQSLIESQQAILDLGGRAIVEMKSLRGIDALLSPGIIDVTEVHPRRDEEVFGPLLNLIRVPDIDAAITEANNSAYGLSAGLLSTSERHYQKFIHEIRAGIVNWNRQITGASGRMPFGGCRLSGNHRPSAFFAADYCSYPVASLEAASIDWPDQPVPGIQVAEDAAPPGQLP
jgi:succinylglutamic semialdehyde dehydrogenase